MPVSFFHSSDVYFLHLAFIFIAVMKHWIEHTSLLPLLVETLTPACPAHFINVLITVEIILTFDPSLLFHWSHGLSHQSTWVCVIISQLPHYLLWSSLPVTPPYMSRSKVTCGNIRLIKTHLPKRVCWLTELQKQDGWWAHTLLNQDIHVGVRMSKLYVQQHHLQSKQWQDKMIKMRFTEAVAVPYL